MPYGVFKTGSGSDPYCVYKTDGDGHRMGEAFGCHPSEEEARGQIMAIGARSHTRASVGDFLLSVKANVGGLMEGQIHQVFSVIADQLLQLGVIDRDQRIELSSAIGDSLDSLHKVIEKHGLDNTELSAEAVETLMGGRLLGGGEDKGAPPPAERQPQPSAQRPQEEQAARALTLEETLVSSGSGLKAVGDGWVEGYLVVWSPNKQRDLGGDYFDDKTDLGWEGRESRTALYHHGLDHTMGKKSLGSGWEFVRRDDVGLWVRTQLDMRDRYESAIYKLCEMGKMGLSSGTASHMIVREDDGRMARWPIVEGSFTPAPMEPRTMVSPLGEIAGRAVPFKSLLSELEGGVIGAPNARGPENTRGGMGNDDWISWYLGILDREVKAMTVDELIGTLRELVPELNDDQLQQIQSILQLGMGETPVGGDEEMRAWTGGGYIDPWKAAAELDTILDTIQSVVQLDDDKLAKITSVLQLALQGAAEEAGEGSYMEDYEDEVVAPMAEEVVAGEEVTEEEIRSIVSDAVYGAMGSGPRVRPRRRAVSRPPYAFTPSARVGGNDMSAGKAAQVLRYGHPDAAVKAIATDLYGGNYEALRYKQHKAFGAFLRHGERALSDDYQRAMKTVVLTPTQLKAFALSGVDVSSFKTEMSEVVDDLGGWLAPEDFRTDMIERLPGLTVVRRRADVLQTGSDMMSRVKVTGGGDRYTSAVRVTWVGDVPSEGDADTNPTFGVERTPIHIAKAVVYVPMSLLEDTPFPLVEKINQWVSEAYALDEDEQFLVGDGIAKPEGILPDEGNGNDLESVASGDADTVTFDGLVGMRYGIGRQYRQGACWTMNDSTASVIAKLKDGDGRYLWQTSNQEGEPDRMLGYPVETSEAMPDVAAGAFPVTFGNYNQGYQIADRIGMSVVRDDVTKAEEDLVKFIFRRRLGGQLKAEWAFCVMEISAS